MAKPNKSLNDMCQKCFSGTTTSSSSTSSAASKSSPKIIHKSSSSRSAETRKVAKTALSTSGALDWPRSEVNRWARCRRKVRLTGFRCRCGELFRSEHRYNDRHICSYDYKPTGREAIARENLVVRAAKIVIVIIL
ncbi:zinc finger A20 and AN1 domain-containing stress-associated protein 5-like [Alnus glutinosa]|uniref:zinc finger A20 and AN1 domain-containing stress-associated protein 5-like n=1 Tax=Alnus glutinosa TaxID=3517 RepID=UPI002D793D67|nr:zinc finger A20 and AN1 domain-containing stress-associated protein 5-like [Alnus glutinosa]